MWINKNCYNTFLKILESFAKGSFEINEECLKQFHGEKYKRLTNAIRCIKSNSKNHIEKSLNILDSFIEGSYSGIDFKEKNLHDYQKIYDKFNLLAKQLEGIDYSIATLQKSIIKDGNIDTRISTDTLKGKWLESITGLNTILEHFEKQLNEINLIVSAVARGDLSQKLTVEAKGKVLELKKTINTMVDQLSLFTSEVTRVAREVGTDGLLGGQAQVKGVSGTWLDLTNNVNSMAESLTNQIRSISKVAIAVANGDLTKSINIDVKGELLELKKYLNSMISDLAKADTENKSQAWIKDGVSILSKEILYKDLLAEQFRIAISQLACYVNAGMGAIYIYKPEENILVMEASYAYIKDDSLPDIFKIGEGPIGQVAYDKKPILLTAESTGLTIKTGTAKYKALNTYISPLVFKDKLVGVVELNSYRAFTPLQLEYVESALSLLSGSFYTSLQAREKKELETRSLKDPLTELFNRGYFDTIIPKIIRYKKDIDDFIYFALLDIDHFKMFNDTYGHPVGDEVLKKVGNILKASSVREDDLYFRIGGEEFAIIFNAENRKKAFDFINKIKYKIEELVIDTKEDKQIHRITISGGLTCKKARAIENFEILFKETDKLLYMAKKAGRNKIVQNS